MHPRAHPALPPRSSEPLSALFGASYGEQALADAIERQAASRQRSWSDSDSRFDALGTVVQCPAKMLLTFGKGDDEKRVCSSTHAVESPCTVISIGSNDQWGFERAIAAALPCHIHTLDCTMTPTVPARLRDRVTYHPLCLGERDHTDANGGRHVAWPSLVAELGLSQPPVQLKMDIEGYEWGVLEGLARSGASMLPFSISVELHAWTEVKDVPWQGRWRQHKETAEWMRTLLTHGGYALVDRHDNPYCSMVKVAVLARP